MLTVMPFLSQQQNSFLNTAMAQGYDNNYYEDIIVTANTQPTIKNMNVRQVHLKASL